MAVCPLPNQNQLFSRYMELCGIHRVKKPCTAVLELLEEDQVSRTDRLAKESRALQVPVTALAAELPRVGSDVISLATRTSLCLHDGRPMHVGVRQLIALLELIRDLPLLERLDLSNLSNCFGNQCWYRAADGHTCY